LASGQLALLSHAQNPPSIFEIEITGIIISILMFLLDIIPRLTFIGQNLPCYPTYAVENISSHTLKQNILHPRCDISMKCCEHISRQKIRQHLENFIFLHQFLFFFHRRPLQ